MNRGQRRRQQDDEVRGGRSGRRFGPAGQMTPMHVEGEGRARRGRRTAGQGRGTGSSGGTGEQRERTREGGGGRDGGRCECVGGVYTCTCAGRAMGARACTYGAHCRRRARMYRLCGGRSDLASGAVGVGEGVRRLSRATTARTAHPKFRWHTQRLSTASTWAVAASVHHWNSHTRVHTNERVHTASDEWRRVCAGGVRWRPRGLKRPEQRAPKGHEATPFFDTSRAARA